MKQREKYDRQSPFVLTNITRAVCSNNLFVSKEQQSGRRKLRNIREERARREKANHRCRNI